MSILVCFSVVFLSALSHAFFQLDLGGLLLLYHSSQKQHIPKKTRILASNYILGVLTMIFLSLLAVSYFLLSLGRFLEVPELAVLAVLLFAISLIIFTLYYRIGRSTELWLPRSFARFISSRAKTTSSRIEAFSLGLLTSFAEIPFSVVLFILASDSFLRLAPCLQALAILLYLFVSTLPLLFVRFFIRKGKTVAEIQRWRVKNKLFLRILGGVGFIVLALFIFAFKIAGELF